MKLRDDIINSMMSVYLKKVSGSKIIYEVRHQNDGVTCRLLLSRHITGPSFKFISYVEVMISGNCVHCSSKPFMQKELTIKRQNSLLSNINDNGDNNNKKNV